MWDLRLSLDHAPAGDFVTRAPFGMLKKPLLSSTTNHLVMDLLDIVRPPVSGNRKHGNVCLLSEVFGTVSDLNRCPACARRRRKHTKRADCRQRAGPQHEETSLEPKRGREEPPVPPTERATKKVRFDLTKVPILRYPSVNPDSAQADEENQREPEDARADSPEQEVSKIPSSSSKERPPARPASAQSPTETVELHLGRIHDNQRRNQRNS